MKLPQYVYSDRSRHGQPRLYFWRGRGHRKIRIHERSGTQQFAARYAELMSHSDAGAYKTAPRDTPRLGTMRWLWFQISTDTDYLNQTGQRTRHVTRLIVEKALAEPVKPGSQDTIGDMPIRAFDKKAMKALRDRRADRPEAANNLVKRFRAMYRRAIKSDVEGVDFDPTVGIERLRPRRVGGWPTWKPEDLDAFETRHPIGTKAHLMLALLQYLGVRISDVRQLGPQHVKNGKITFTMHKGRERNPKTLTLAIIPELQRVIDASPTGHLAFLVNEYGGAYTVKGVGNKFRQWCDEAGLRELSAHGVRKAAAVRAAHNRRTAHELKETFGWLTLAQAELYTRDADQERLADRGIEGLARNKAG